MFTYWTQYCNRKIVSLRKTIGNWFVVIYRVRFLHVLTLPNSFYFVRSPSADTAQCNEILSKTVILDPQSSGLQAVRRLFSEEYTRSPRSRRYELNI